MSDVYSCSHGQLLVEVGIDHLLAVPILILPPFIPLHHAGHVVVHVAYEPPPEQGR